jgi:hypothetical protein
MNSNDLEGDMSALAEPFVAGASTFWNQTATFSTGVRKTEIATLNGALL